MGRVTGQALRERIVSEALAMVREHGVGAVTMRQLAERLGYSPATIYLYFANKEELLAEVAQVGFEELLARSEPALGKPEASEALDAGVRAYASFAFEEPELYQLMFLQHEPGAAQEASGARARLWQLWRDVYARGTDDGLAGSDADPETRTLLAWSLLHGLVTLALSRQPLASLHEGRPVEEVREALVGRAAGILLAA